MTEVRWSPLASRDLERIEAYYREAAPDVAATLVGRMVSATRLLRDHPYAGPIELHGTRRKRRVAKTPYNLFYRVAGDHVRILRVIHVAQDQARR